MAGPTPTMRRLSRLHASKRLVLPDRVYRALKHQILTCRLGPCQRVVEKDICESLAVSRTPVREALNRLGLEGLVVSSPFSGYTVAPLTVGDIRGLNEVRRIVECEAAALAAERATLADIERIRARANLSYVPGERPTYARGLEENRLFHLAIAHATRNGLLEAIVASVLDQIERAIYFGLDSAKDPSSPNSLHLELVKAIAEHSPSKAGKIMADDIRCSEEDMLQACLRWQM